MSVLDAIDAAELRPSERRVARVIRSDYPASALSTVAAIADAAGVSNPTVVRFAKAIGHGSFSAMQDAVRAELSTRRGPLGKLDHRPAGATADLAGFARAVADAAVSSLARIPATELDAAVDALVARKGWVLTVGGRYSRVLAAHLAINLATVRPRVQQLEDPLGRSLTRLVDVDARDTVVVFDSARYQRSSVRAAELASARGATVLLVTDPGLSPAARHASVVLPVADAAPTPLDSAAGAVLLVDYLVARSIDRLGDAATARLQQWEPSREGELLA
ncbi:MurR/RpiR family transcriptional regulator [Agrococcus versicolor]|uniref:MurR/RpiR family transcriptional regulator n=1 Tax=Agrococcus versicolor TaxID=501482 RepID=UPI0031D3A0A0